MLRRSIVTCWSAVWLGACAGGAVAPSVERAQEAMIETSGRRGNVWLSCLPESAQIILEGVLQGRCGDLAAAGRGLTVKGQSLHRLEVRLPGHQTYVTYIAPGGARATLSVQLVPLASEEKAP